jgi:hypothetical protein
MDGDFVAHAHLAAAELIELLDDCEEDGLLHANILPGFTDGLDNKINNSSSNNNDAEAAGKETATGDLTEDEGMRYCFMFMKTSFN